MRTAWAMSARRASSTVVMSSPTKMIRGGSGGSSKLSGGRRPIGPRMNPAGGPTGSNRR